MVRIGKNPSKNKKINKDDPYVSCCMITYAPELSGYWSDMADVVKFSILSLRKNTNIDIELIVFDNGSCKEFINNLIELKNEKLIDKLILYSNNIGKIGGINVLSKIFSGKYFMYSDSDIFFMPNWLERHIEIFEAFEKHGLKPGMITGTPLPIGDIDRAAKSLTEVAGVEVRNHVLSEEYLKMHADDIGKPVNRIAKNLHKTGYIVSVDGINAFLGAWHMQFLMSGELAKHIFPLPTNFALSGDEDRQIENTVESLGYLRLSPPEPVLRHIGNFICGDLKDEYDKLSIGRNQINKINSYDFNQSCIYRIYLYIRRLYSKYLKIK